ncbi:MAG: CoA transferase, partial [Dehalococcoidia bacterium]
MEGPLVGIRALEVANYLAVPSATALMADMGAQVIKVEPLEGDVYRHAARSIEFEFDFPINYAFELDNRGKRSVALDLEKKEAVQVVWRLAERADVFMTNLVPRRKERYRLRYEDLSPRNPRLIYLAFSGYGPEGPEKDRLGFDHTAFWARSGIMSLLSDPDRPPIDLHSGMGDHTSSPLLLAGVLAALLARERSGRGQEVTASLLNMGLWVIGADVQEGLVARREPRRYHRSEAPNPLHNTYRTRDGRWLNLVMLHTDDSWSRLCKALGRDDLLEVSRYGVLEDRTARSSDLVAELDKTFGSMTVEELAPRLDDNSIVWAPMQLLSEVFDDPQV